MNMTRIQHRHQIAGGFFDREKTAGVIFCLPLIIGFSFFIVIPMLNSLFYSFCDYNILKPAKWVGLENYAKLFQDAKFWKSLTVTLKYALISFSSLISTSTSEKPLEEGALAGLQFGVTTSVM